MKTGQIIEYSLLAVFILFYLIYTIRYTIVFTKNNFFTGRKKAFHLVMIWLIPFLWALLLKTVVKPIPGSYQIEQKKNSDEYKDNKESEAIWASNSFPPDLR